MACVAIVDPSPGSSVVAEAISRGHAVISVQSRTMSAEMSKGCIDVQFLAQVDEQRELWQTVSQLRSACGGGCEGLELAEIRYDMATGASLANSLKNAMFKASAHYHSTPSETSVEMAPKKPLIADPIQGKLQSACIALIDPLPTTYAAEVMSLGCSVIAVWSSNVDAEMKLQSRHGTETPDYLAELEEKPEVWQTIAELRSACGGGSEGLELLGFYCESASGAALASRLSKAMGLRAHGMLIDSSCPDSRQKRMMEADVKMVW